MPTTKPKYNPYVPAVFLLIASAVLMLFGSMASPLFPIHTGVDQNTFLTVGRAMCEGDVLYRDIFEQKGPLLYVLHALAYVIDSDGFFGVYLLEVLSFWGYLLLLRRIAAEFASDTAALAASALSGWLTVISYTFSRGDNAEEFCLPLLAAGLLGLILYTESDRDMPPLSVSLIAGVCAGCVLWIKFTMLGFYIAWVLCVFFITLRRGGIKHALLAVAQFLLGMLLATLPWLLYFLYHGALYSLWEVYFYANIFLYSGQTTILSRVLSIFTKDFLWNPPLFLAIVIGILWILRAPLPIRKETRLSITAVWFLLYFFLFVGGTRYRYYFLIMALFSVFGFLALARPLAERTQRQLTVPLVCAAGLLSAVLFGNCAGSYLIPAAEYPQYQFAARMKEGASLLNYRFLDGGFYLAAQSPLPDTRYPLTVNIPRENLPAQFDEQDLLIETAAVDYVVTRYRLDGDPEGKEPPCAALEENYTLIFETEDGANRKGARTYGYCLYQKKEKGGV